MSDLIERLRYKYADILHREAADRIEELEDRLELWPVDPETGELVKDEKLPQSCDGIACRDETIRLQDRRIKRLEQEVLHHIGECVDNCKFCGE